MRKLKLYLDTSVLNFFYADDCVNEQQVTKELFEEIKKGEFEAIASESVALEISKAPLEIKEKLEILIKKYEIKIENENKEILSLANEYIKIGIIPKRFENDAIIIAAATFYRVDVLVSWNFKHIVKLKTKREVNAINQLNGYGMIEIYSPLEVIEND